MSFLKFIPLLLLLPSCNLNSPKNLPVSEETIAKEISNSKSNSKNNLDKPYVVLVSIDGFRYDYNDLYECENLSKFQVNAIAMRPSFPSKTFPNHYTIVSGKYPGSNGLVSNKFYDRKLKRMYSPAYRDEVEDDIWYHGTPLWVLAQEQNMLSASMFWIGSEAPIRGQHPSYYYNYDEDINHQDRVNTVINWLLLPEEKRPHFITLYFSDTDDIGHDYGPKSAEMSETVHFIDSIIGDLQLKLDATGLPINLIVLSDHGMKEINRFDLVNISEYLDQENMDDAVITMNMPVMIYSSDSTFLSNSYTQLITDDRIDTYWRDSLPEHYHYSDLSRIGDIVIMPKPGYYISERDSLPSGYSTHGYVPEDCDAMQAIFYADGPAFNNYSDFPVFENIHVYPLVASILGLEYEENSIDGKKEVLAPLLK